jgi:hypothetical protein
VDASVFGNRFTGHVLINLSSVKKVAESLWDRSVKLVVDNLSRNFLP